MDYIPGSYLLYQDWCCPCFYCWWSRNNPSVSWLYVDGCCFYNCSRRLKKSTDCEDLFPERPQLKPTHHQSWYSEQFSRDEIHVSGLVTSKKNRKSKKKWISRLIRDKKKLDNSETWRNAYLVSSKHHESWFWAFVVRWAQGKRLTDHPPNLSLITLSPLERTGYIYGSTCHQNAVPIFGDPEVFSDYWHEKSRFFCF